MSRLISDLIRAKVAADAIDDIAADNLVALIHDALPANAGLDAVDLAIAKARQGYAPLFRKPVPTHQAQPKRRVLATVGGVIPLKREAGR